MGEFLTRNVKKENEEQYKGGWPVSADARRTLYLKYANYPIDIAVSRGEIPVELSNAVHAGRFSEEVLRAVESGVIPEEVKAAIEAGDLKPEIRDMWQEIAAELMDIFGPGEGRRGLDIGSSSGYFAEQLLEAGYKGEYIGVDLETKHQALLQDVLRFRYPEASILFGKANAENLKKIEIDSDDGLGQNEAIRAVSIPIEPDSFDFVTELFVMYHIPQFRKAYKQTHRVLKPGGIAVFSGRHPLNQNSLWNLGAEIATNLGATVPQSFYTHHSNSDMGEYLNASPMYEVLKHGRQAQELWIPASDDGWAYYRAALMSLRPMMKDKDNRMINGPLLGRYLDEVIRPSRFEPQAAVNNGYFIDYVFQDYFVCRAIK